MEAKNSVFTEKLNLLKLSNISADNDLLCWNGNFYWTDRSVLNKVKKEKKCKIRFLWKISFQLVINYISRLLLTFSTRSNFLIIFYSPPLDFYLPFYSLYTPLPSQHAFLLTPGPNDTEFGRKSLKILCFGTFNMLGLVYCCFTVKL